MSRLLGFLIVLVIVGPAWADPNIYDTKLLTQPAVSKDRIAFVYADDLWICDLNGHNVRRLTSDTGVESHRQERS